MTWLKILTNWVKYSGVWIGFVLNPYHWEPDVKFKTRNSELTDGDIWGIMFLEINLGFVWLRIVIDDGRW